MALRQRVLKNVEGVSLETQFFDEQVSMPLALAPACLKQAMLCQYRKCRRNIEVAGGFALRMVRQVV